MIAQEIIDAARLAVPIETVASEYVGLRRAGSQFVGVCILCRGKSQSFKVNPDKQVFFCHRCGAGGDVFELVAKIENLTFPESVALLARRTGISVDGEISAEARERIARARRARANEERLGSFINGRQAGMNREFYLLGCAVTRGEDFLDDKLFDAGWRPSWAEAFKAELVWAAIQAYFEVGNRFFSRDRLCGRDAWIKNEFEPEPRYSRAALERLAGANAQA